MRPHPQAAALWAYSLALYGRPGVKDALLALQDQHGVDVNVLLLGCWLASDHGVVLASPDWRRLRRAGQAWRSGVTEVLRALRRRLAADAALAAVPGSGALRDQVLAAEIESERGAQMLLLDALPRPWSTVPVLPAEAPDVAAERAARSLQGCVRVYAGGRAAARADADAALRRLLAAAFASPDAQ